MSVKNNQSWPVAQQPPTLTNNQWYLMSFIGIIFFLAATLQIIGFQNFSDNLASMGLSSSNWWGGAIVFTELWAAASFFKIRLSWLFRKFSNFFALTVAGFWFFESVRQAAMAPDEISPISNMNYFGHFLSQAPGWWTVIESTVFILVILYTLEQVMQKNAKRAQVVTKVSRTHGKKGTV
jgi:hypothetical protein